MFLLIHLLPFALFHYSVFNYMCFTVTFHRCGTHMRTELLFSLRKHAYYNILKILLPKHENFQIKNSDSFFLFLLKIEIVGTR